MVKTLDRQTDRQTVKERKKIFREVMLWSNFVTDYWSDRPATVHTTDPTPQAHSPCAEATCTLIHFAERKYLRDRVIVLNTGSGGPR